MKLKLTFIAVLLCTLFFACKKNEILNDETGRVSAGGPYYPIVDEPNPDIIDLSSISIPPLQTVQTIDQQSEHSFTNCSNIPANVPFYINVGMFQENPNDYSILIEYETNPSYIGFDDVVAIEWDYCISYRPIDDIGNFSNCQWESYNKDNLLITIPRTEQDIKLAVNGTCLIGSVNYYYSFEHIIDATIIQLNGDLILYNIFDFEVTQGTAVNCQCSYCSRSYTLVLP